MSKKHHHAIDEETMFVLRRATITDTTVKLPAGQLARPLYEKVNKVLALAGGEWNRSAKAHVFQGDPRIALGIALEDGTKKATQAFYTPLEIARRVLAHASVKGKHALEPSAGRGAIADTILEAGAESLVCIEQDTESVRHLRSLGHTVIEADFLACRAGRTAGIKKDHFDRIVMNPPFTNGQDVDHVTHAFNDMLKSGGRLVAIMSPSWQTKADKRSAAFRDLLAEHGSIAEKLPAGSFKESGTNIATVIIALVKP